MTPNNRDTTFLLIVSGLIVVCFYIFFTVQARVGGPALALSPESERLREELVKLSTDLDASSLEGRACRASIADYLYALRKDSVSARVALEAAAQREVHAAVLFMALLVLGVATLILGTGLLSRTGRSPEESAIEGTQPRVRAGLAALTVSVAAFAVLAIQLGLDRHVPAQPAPAALSLDLAAFVERCEDYRQTGD